MLHEWDTDLDDAISFDEFRKLLREQHVRRAALYIEDGLSARSAHRLGARNLWMHRLYTSSRWQNFVLLICLIHMSLAFFEYPGNMEPTHVPRVGRLNSIVLDHPMFRYVLLGVEAMCVAIYFFDIYLYNGFRPRHSRNTDGAATSAWSIPGQRQRDLWIMARLAIAMAMTLDVLLAFSGLRMFRFTRPLRPFVLTSRKRGAKTVLNNIVYTVPQQGKVFFAIFSVSALWGFVGFLLYSHVDYESFGTMSRSIVTMLIIFLSPSYNQQVAENKLAEEKYRASAAVLFVSYMVICNMFLLRLITAVAFDSFQKFAREERISVLSARKDALDRAFDLVASPVDDTPDAGGSDALREPNFHMSRASFVDIMQLADQHSGSSRVSCLCVNRRLKTHDLQPSEKAQLLFELADTDNDETLSLTEFYSVCYLWRYARIVQIDRPGQHFVKLGQRWVPSGINVHFRGGDTQVHDANTWRRGVVVDNTDDDKVKVMAVNPSVLAPGSLQTGLMAQPAGIGTLNAESLSEVSEADIRIAICDHPIFALEGLLEFRVHVPLISRKIRAFDVGMSICVLLNIVQLGYSASFDSVQERDDSTIAVAVVFLLAFCFETFIKLLVWGWVRYNDRGFSIDVVTASAGVLQYLMLLARRDFDVDVHASLSFHQVLMILQALRVVKLLRIAAPALYNAVHRVASHTLDYGYVFMLLLYVSAVVGQELFAGQLSHIKNDPDFANWARLSHVYSFDDFGSSILALFEVSLVANWWIVMAAAVEATGSAVKARAFFFTFKILFYVLYLPIFVGFIITAFSKINSQTQDDYANGATSGVIAELPGVPNAAAVSKRGPDEDGAARAQQSQTKVSAAVRPRRFLVKVLTDITNKLYGIDPEMTRLRRQLQEHQSHLEALLIEQSAKEQRMAQMQAVLDRHGLSVDSLDAVDSSVEVHLPDQHQGRQRQQQGEDEAAEEEGRLGRPPAAAAMPIASGPPRRRAYETSSSPNPPRTPSPDSSFERAPGAINRVGGLQRTFSRPSESSFGTPTIVVADMLSRSYREPVAGLPVVDMGEELASLDDRASRAGRYWSTVQAANKLTQIQ